MILVMYGTKNTKRHIIDANDYKEREILYNYLHREYDIKDKCDKEFILSSKYPLIVDLEKNELSLLESITCSACASQNNKLTGINEFMKGE